MTELEEIKKEVHALGFNISMMINKFKKMQKANHARYDIPDEVYVELCKTAKERLLMRKITAPWPYFIHVLNMKSADYFARKNKEEARETQFCKTMPESIRSIMKGV